MLKEILYIKENCKFANLYEFLMKVKMILNLIESVNERNSYSNMKQVEEFYILY